MTKAELQAVWTITKSLKQVQTRLLALQDVIKNLTPKLDGLPKNKTYSDRRADLIAKKLDAEKELESLRNQLELEKVGLTEKILATSNVNEVQRRILILRYVNCLMFKEIAVQVQYSEQHVYTIHRQALKEIK